MKKNEVFLRHVIDEIEFIQKYVAGKVLNDLTSDELAKRAVERSFSIIGEAVAKLSDDIKNQNDYIPWRQIKDFRNRIIHDYFDVDYQTMWDIIENKLPELKLQITKILSEIKGLNG